MCFSSFYHKIMFSAVKNAKAVLISFFHSYNSFSYTEKKNMHMCTNFWISPHNGKLPSRLTPAQCQNSLAPQLLSNNYWSKTSISLNRVYWYDTMCHIFSCYYWNQNPSSVFTLWNTDVFIVRFASGSAREVPKLVCKIFLTFNEWHTQNLLNDCLPFCSQSIC